MDNKEGKVLSIREYYKWEIDCTSRKAARQLASAMRSAGYDVHVEEELVFTDMPEEICEGIAREVGYAVAWVRLVDQPECPQEARLESSDRQDEIL